jgi:hypothetical protein
MVNHDVLSALFLADLMKVQWLYFWTALIMGANTFRVPKFFPSTAFLRSKKLKAKGWLGMVGNWGQG